MSLDTHPSASMGRSQYSRHLSFALVVLLCGTVWSYIQFASPYLIDHDAYYHLRVAALIREQGLPLTFPWLPGTLLDEAHYTDHHMLMHVLQIPFTYLGDLGLAAKWSAVAFATFALVTFYWITRYYEIPYPALWLAVLVASSSGFLFRMSMPRGQSLSLAFQLIAFHLLIRRNAISLFLLSVLFVWTYNGFLILLPLAVFAIVAHAVVERSLRLNLFVAVIGGIVIGLVIHPYFPRDIQFLWNHVAPKLLTVSYETRVGTEWYPYSSWVLLTNAGLAVVAYVFALVLTNREDWRTDAPRIFWALTATMYLFLLFKSRRFVEYFPPTAVLFLAFTWRGWARTIQWPAVISARMRWSGMVAGGLALFSLCYTAVSRVRAEIADSPPTNAYQRAAEWLANHTPRGAIVFHTDWDDFPKLFFFNTHNTYVVGLDPDFLRLRDERRFLLWLAIAQAKHSAPEDAILNEFGADYVFTDNTHSDFIDAATQSPRMEEVYSDEAATIYRVLENSASLNPNEQ